MTSDKPEEEGYTYVFEMGAQPPSKFRRKIWQIVASIGASLVCVPYGIMLGWPSPTYPRLIIPESHIWITMDQTAMIAGFLMIGNSIGTPFSSLRKIESKYGLIVASTLMTISWIIMWQAKNIYWLLASRILLGAGNGTGLGQLKFYITEICQDSLAKTQVQYINLYVFFGVILAFAYGPYVSFSHFGIISTIIAVFIMFLTIFLPSTPRELIRSGKNAEAAKLIAFLSPELDIDQEINKIKRRIDCEDNSIGFCDLMKESNMRKKLGIFVLLVFFQQFSGIPATIVYSQMIFERSGCHHPEVCALIYSIGYFLANFYAIFAVPNCNKKRFLMISALAVSVILIVKVIVLVENLNRTFWSFTSLIVLLLYMCLHTIGLGNVPVSLIPDLFPPQTYKILSHIFIILHSILALIITKIFQVMFHQIGLFAPFCLFFVVSTFSLIFTIIFVPDQCKSDENT